MNNSTITL